MPDPGLQPPYLDPSQYPNYLDAERKQMVANMLLQGLQTSGQTPANWNSMPVVPHKGLLSSVAPLVQALMAQKGMKNAQQANQTYFQGLYGGGQPPATAQPPGGAPASPGTPTPAAGNLPAQPSAAPSNPMLLTGDPRTSQAMLSMMGPQEYGKALAAKYQPLELDRKLTAAGITDPALRQQIIQASIAKENYIAPIDVRPGGTLVDPTSRQPFFTGPQNGVQTNWGPGGPQAASVPGAAAASAAMTAAETGAKVANTPMTVSTAGGGSAVGYPGQLIGAPPAAGGAPPTRGAPTTQGTAGATSTANPKDPWATLPKLQIPTGVGESDYFTQGRLKASGEKDATLSGQLGNEAALADQQLEYSREARAALPAADTGPMSEWLTRNRSALLELGVPSNLIPESGSVTPTLELNKALKNAALQGARTIYGPRMTQTEVKLQTEEMSPSASMMRDAIASLMQQNDVRSLYAKQRAEDYGKFRGQGGDPMRFESWYANKFPLATFARAAQATPAEIAAEMKRRGLQ